MAFTFHTIMFSETEQAVIREKLLQLAEVKDGRLPLKELSNIISRRRIVWMQSHKNEILEKYKGMPLEEIAWRAVAFDHMHIDPSGSIMTRVSDKKIRVDSYNFCPYLEACMQLELDTRHICKEIDEVCIQKMIEILDPRLKFSRNYNNMRPHSDFCEEYFELL